MPPPLLSPVSLVGTQVQQAMGVLEQAQLLSQLAGGVPANSTLGVLRSVEAVPGVIAPADAARIRDLIQNGNEGEALQKLAAYHDVLVLAHQECVAGVPAAATLPLERIAALFGLAAGEFSTYYGANDATRGRVWSSAPALDEAAAPRVELDFQGVVREFRLSSPDHGRGLAIHVGRDGSSGVLLADPSVSAKHAEIVFVNGRYSVKDPGRTNGTWVNGVRLQAHEQKRIKDGDRLTMGRYDIIVRLPYELRLRRIETAMAQAVSYNEVFQVLNEQGFGDAASKAKSILLLPVSVNERLERLREAIPHDGGLLIKLEAFLLRGEIVRVRSLYFPNLTPPQALDTGTRLAASLAQARTFADLSDRLLRTNEETFRPWIEAIAKLERYRLGYKLEEGFALDVFPKTFGLYDQVARLFFEGLALKEDQKQDLKYRGVTPDLLLERPWRKFQVSPLLDAALEPFHGAIGGRLNWEAMETTLQAAFSDETDVPTESGLSKTRAILYNEYQAQQPVTDSLTGSVTGGAANPVTESRKPGYFDRIAERLRADGILAYPGSYWLFGGGLDSEDVHGRVYLSLRRRHVEAIYRYLHGPLQAGAKADGAQVQFKIAWNAEGYSRSDSGVIYFDAKDQETIHRLVARMSREHPEFFKDGHPHFTLPLRGENGAVLQGLSFGEQPAYAHQSFGSLRTDSMTGAVRVARALMGTAEPPDWDEVKQICAYFLRRSGVDIENPAFNEGGRAKFGPLLRRNAVPAPAPAPAPRPAVAVNPDDMRALIAREVVERYPGLRAAPAEKLVKVLAKHMYIAWESSGRFAGSSPEAPSYLPEDIFEEKMAQALGRLEKDRGNPTVEPLRQAIADGDQGARVLRQLKARLRHESPLLNDPQNEKLLKTLAGNIYKSWSAGPQTADALEELFRRRLGLLVEHYKTNGTDDPFKQRLRQELETILSHP